MSHDRTLDHHGTEDTTTSVLSAAIGRYPAGTTVQEVLADMIGRLTRLETYTIGGHYFTANAVLIGEAFSADAIIKNTRSILLVLDAYIHGWMFTANAVLQATATPETASTSFTAQALFIEHAPGSGSGSLVDPIDADDTTVNVSNPDSFPPTFPFVIVIDGEQMLVTGGTPGAWIVQRGYNGTTATSHSAGATVTEVC